MARAFERVQMQEETRTISRLGGALPTIPTRVMKSLQSSRESVSRRIPNCCNYPTQIHWSHTACMAPKKE